MLCDSRTVIYDRGVIIINLTISACCGLSLCRCPSRRGCFDEFPDDHDEEEGEWEANRRASLPRDVGGGSKKSKRPQENVSGARQ